MHESIEGWWLNLDSDPDRAAAMQGRLSDLGLQSSYSRFRAHRGDPEHAAARGLRVGEEGAWRSWLAMMSRAASSAAEVVHLLEDDVEISRGIFRLFAWTELNGYLERFDWLCTDAYVSPAQVRQLLELLNGLDGFRVVDSGFTVPCISSFISTPHQVSSIYDRLLVLWEGQARLPPVDVALGNLALIGEFSFGSVVPFVTGPTPLLARRSNTRKSCDTCLERSREVLTLLRRLLMGTS